MNATDPAAPAIDDGEQEAQRQAPAQPAAETPRDTTTSALDGLRREFAEGVEERRLWKRLPARSERLVAEYQPLALTDAKKAIEKESDPQMLVSSLKGIWIRGDAESPDANERGLVPLGAFCGAPLLDPLGFDKRLTDLLEIPFGSAATICLGLFEGNDLALAAQAAELGEWSVRTVEAGGSPGFRSALIENEAVQGAGLALACGLNPLSVLDCRDPVEVIALEEVVMAAAKIHGQWRQDIASRFAEVMAKILS